MATNGPGVVMTGADLTRGQGRLTSRRPEARWTLGLEMGRGLLQSLTCDTKGGHSGFPSGTFLPCPQRGPWLSLPLPLPVARFTSSPGPVSMQPRSSRPGASCVHTADRVGSSGGLGRCSWAHASPRGLCPAGPGL